MSLNGCVNMHDLNWGCTGGQLSELPSIYTSSENIYEPIGQANRLLQNLNCVGCSNIRKVFIPPAARCVHLSSLNLSLSANLKEVDLACFNLCFLNLRYHFFFLDMVKFVCDHTDVLSVLMYIYIYFLFLILFSNCCSLEILKLECPRLTSLFLQVCILHSMFEALNHFLGMSVEDMKLIFTIFFFGWS